jgi:hypothetical protein
MDAFITELMRRSPLATAVLDICDYLFDQQLLDDIWNNHRGRCYNDKLLFPDFLRLMRDALIRHGGSAHKLFVQLESCDAHPIDESNFYRKLRNIPVTLSRALLSQCTQRLLPLMPVAATTLPACFDTYQVVVGDGKAIKKVAKRLAPTRGYIGKLIGAKARVAMDLRSGMAIAMNDTLDGMANEVPLVPGLMPQLHQASGTRAILSVWDRQFDDAATMRLLSSRPGDAFVVRMKHKNMRFAVETAVKTQDDQGREVLDEIGILGTGKKAMRLRRITLSRDGAAGEDDVVLLTNLMDRDRFSVVDLLALYKKRWGIEQMFQQITETFSLSHLIGCSPKAVLLQLAYCLLLYNVMQLVKAYVAEDGKVKPSVVSMHYLFEDVRTELKAWAYHTEGQWPGSLRDAAGLMTHLRQLLSGSWNAKRYTKASDKNPRKVHGTKKQWLSGGHTSVQRALEGKAKVVKRRKVVTREKVIPTG